MLSALRPPEQSSAPRYTSSSASAAHSRAPADPSELPPDRLHVEMEISPDSQVLLYGPMLRALLAIKVCGTAQPGTSPSAELLPELVLLFFPQENYFGEDDMYTDFEEAVSSPVLSTATSSGLGWMDDGEQKDGSDAHPLDLRPWDITVLINLYKVHGRLPVVSNVPVRLCTKFCSDFCNMNAIRRSILPALQQRRSRRPVWLPGAALL